jgi:AraC-like DNA-binding protein
MSSIVAERRPEVIPEVPSSTRAGRPFPRDVVDLLCVEEAGADVRPRMHSRFSVVLLRTPAVVRLESSRSIVADRNCILLVPPRHLYALRALAGLVTGPRRSPLILQVGPMHLAALAQAKRPALVSDADVGERLASLIVQLQRPIRLVDCEADIESIIDRLEACSSEVELARAGFAMETLMAVREYLHTHLDEPTSTAALSRFSGLTESHLIRAFHREFGLPPHAYHMQLRLAQACEALASGLSVSTVAYECGFADQSHLSRTFKQAYGLTPAAWANAVAAPRHAELYSSR